MLPAVRVLENIAGALSVLWHVLLVFYQVLEQKICRHKTRRALTKLNSWQLEDIGISEDQRRRELAKWFWQE